MKPKSQDMIQVKIKFIYGTQDSVEYGTISYTVEQGIGFDSLQQAVQAYLDQEYEGAKILSVVYE